MLSLIMKYLYTVTTETIWWLLPTYTNSLSIPEVTVFIFPPILILLVQWTGLLSLFTLCK